MSSARLLSIAGGVFPEKLFLYGWILACILLESIRFSHIFFLKNAQIAEDNFFKLASHKSEDLPL